MLLIETRKNHVQASVTENKIIYTNLYPKVDLRYIVGSNRVKEDIVIKEKPTKDTPVVFTYTVNLKGLDYEIKPDGRVFFIHPKTKEPLFYLEKPFMYDSYQPEGYQKNEGVIDVPEQSLSYDVDMKLEKRGQQLYINIIPERSWLEDNKRVYPVVIDPTIVKYQPGASLEDTNIRSYYPNTTGGADTALGVGLYQSSTETNKIRTLLKFDVSSIPVGSKVLDAQLNLWMSSVWNDTPIRVDLHEVTNTWTENGATWLKRDGVNAWTTSGGDYQSTPLSYLEDIGELLDLSFNLKWQVPTNVVEKWISNPQQNKGLLLKSHDETVKTYKKFISGDHSLTEYSPLLVVTYYSASRLGLEPFWDYDEHSLVGGTSYTNLTTGNNVVQYTDFSITGRGNFGFDFTRTYNSKSVEDSPLGYRWTFTGNEKLTEVYNRNEVIYTDADGTAHTFIYNPSTQMYQSPKGKYLTLRKVTNGYEIIDKYGIKTFFEREAPDWTTYVTVAKIRYKEDRHGNRITYNYDSNNRLINVTDPSGRMLTLTYNAQGKIAQIQFEGRKVVYTYDTNGRLKTVDQYKNATEYSRTEYQYNSDGRLATIIDPNGRKTDFTYNQEFLQKVQEPSGEGAEKDLPTRPGTTYTYDTVNRITTVTEPEGNTTTYYTNSNFVTIKMVDAAGQEIQFVLDDNYNPLEIINPDGTKVVNTYDSKGNLLTTTDEEGNRTTYTYDSFSNVKTKTDSRGNTTTYDYNQYGDLTTITDPKGQKTTFIYDAYGNLKTKTYPNGTVESYSYDDNGNYVKTVTDPAGNTVTTITDEVGNVISYKDGKGYETKYGYDQHNQLTKVIDAKLNETSYEYDSSGNKTAIIDAKGHISRYEYNGKNLLTKYTDQLGKSTLIDYDLNGNRTKVVSPSGDVITYAYDKLNQLTDVYVNGIKQWSYTYDQNGNIKTATDSQGRSKTYDYYDNGLLKQVVDGNHTISYGYAGNEFLSSINVTAGNSTLSLGFTPNELNQLQTLTRNGQTLASFGYNALGAIESVTRGNGTSTNKTFDQANRLKTLTNKLANGTELNSYTYHYDQNNNIETIVTNHGTVSYQYDELNQLVRETLLDGTVINYEYDSVGNRTKKIVTKDGNSTTTSYSYNAANQLTEVNGQAYQYDDNGNLTNDGERTYIYDAFNQLVEVRDASGQWIAKFTYDDSGKRTSMTTANGTVYFHYHQDKVIYETDENDHIIAEYTWDDEGHPVKMTKNGQTYYYHLNGHGDVVALTDNNGNVVAEYEYDAWGNILHQTGPLASENPYRYAGYRYDEETGLYYLLARYYNPNNGNFLSVDPYPGDLDNPISQNRYVYANSNPVMFVDPDGKTAVVVGVYFIPGIGEVALLATGAVVLGGITYKAGSWLGQKVRDYVFSKKTPIPSKLKNGDRVKTPDTHPGEWTKKGDTYTHKKTKWKAKVDKSGHRGRHYDLSPPNGKTGDYYNVSPDGRIL
ncbi:DNRLRE domain-containing protein [Ureibacillus terrenus]|uniref:DNRLRE domain-containing protein n=1 Tax=Ureibacillus terrenus TaxID=118246 RepID=UPI002E1DA833|nr:DNRLRE domain-containing protein [Ureibacillus terrenus]